MRILVVEDDPRISELLARGLRDEGLLVDLAHNARQALEATSDVAYDTVVLDAGDIVAFAGPALRPTPHHFKIGDRKLHAWCAWDTLFLPTLLNATAVVRSRCPVTDRTIKLVVAPDGVKSSRPEDLHVSFPWLAATDTANITGSFCCDVFFLAGTAAARTWRATHAEGVVLDLRAAYELGCRAIKPMLGSASPAGMEMSR